MAGERSGGQRTRTSKGFHPLVFKTAPLGDARPLASTNVPNDRYLRSRSTLPMGREYPPGARCSGGTGGGQVNPDGLGHSPNHRQH
jgi:hypothetical protein